MSYGLPKYEARFAVPDGGWTLSVTDSGGTAVITLPAGNYYLTATSSLLDALETALNANATLAGTFTVALDDDNRTSTGRVTISATGGGNFTVTWTSTALRDLLGFTAGLSGAASYLATTASAAPLWMPDAPRARPLVPDGHAGRLVAATTCTISPTTGRSRFLKFGSYRSDSWEHHFVTGRKTYTQYETYDNESFESFWENYVSEGAPIAYFPDRSADGTYVEWRVVEAAMFPAKEVIEGYVGDATEGGNLLHTIGPMAVIEYVDG